MDKTILHYNEAATNYGQQYQRENLYNARLHYPANYFRLQLLLNSFISAKVKRVIEVGVGEGTPLVTLAKSGIDVCGFDISINMVNQGKQTFQNNDMDPENIFLGDIRDPITYTHALKNGQFDGMVAMGVMPHVENDDQVLKNMACLIRPGGKVYIEFRNKLFSLFTFNRYTVEFILDDLLANVNPQLKNMVAKDLESRLRIDMPTLRTKSDMAEAPGYDDLIAKFHNPLEIADIFKKHGFQNINLLWYHYHPSMPYLASEKPELFRQEAMRLEHEASNWRGYFLCSAFVVEATKE